LFATHFTHYFVVEWSRELQQPALLVAMEQMMGRLAQPTSMTKYSKTGPDRTQLDLDPHFI